MRLYLYFFLLLIMINICNEKNEYFNVINEIKLIFILKFVLIGSVIDVLLKLIKEEFLCVFK